MGWKSVGDGGERGVDAEMEVSGMCETRREDNGGEEGGWRGRGRLLEASRARGGVRVWLENGRGRREGHAGNEESAAGDYR